MTGYLIRRVLTLVPVWGLVSLMAFGLSNLTPGDPARLILLRSSEEVPTAGAVAQLRTELGLDDAFAVRYLRWVGDAVTGDLGTSYRTGRPVASELWRHFLVTLELAVPAFLLAVAIAVPIGVLSAVRRDSILDHGTRLGALVASSLPSYWLGYVFILVFAVRNPWLPVAGRGGLEHLVLPAVTLALGSAAGLARLTRSSLLDVLGEDHVRTARAKGLGEPAVVTFHGLRSGLLPVVTLMGLAFGQLLAGAAIVETVFAWPGLGSYVVDAIYDRDYPTIQGFVLFGGTVFLALNLAVDLLYVRLDPRVRMGGNRVG